MKTFLKRPATWVVLALLASCPACGDADDAGHAGDGDSGGPPPYAGYVAGDGAMPEQLWQKIDAALAKGRAYLATQQQENGGIGYPGDGLPGMTSMGVIGLIASTPREGVREDERIQNALDYLVGMQNDKGAIVEKTGKTNYITSVVVSALAFSRDPGFTKNLVLARDYIERSQIAGADSDLSYGGFPYKQAQGQPADLSNGQYAFEALKNAERTGQKADPKVWERGQRFLGRVQNRSETNTQPVRVKLESGETVEVVSGNDGGAVYYPGSSKVGPPEKQADGTYVIESYGSMTYALLKCLLFCGVEASDPRVEAAISWIRNNWTVDENPGFRDEVDAYQGYLYYLHTATRALAEYEKYTGAPLVIRDANGEKHDWRVEMAEKILSMQHEDGSFTNQRSERWDEKLPVLGTSYMLQALAFITGRLP